MLFTSAAFLLFFPIFFSLYWFVFNKHLKLQNLLVLLASYVFYAWGDLRFLPFLIGVSALNYILGIQIEKATTYKRALLWIGMLQGIGSLAFFKYFNFFLATINDTASLFGSQTNLQMWNIIIPLGISFFTFRTISYLMDIYNGKAKATTDWIVFFGYVAFFPSILSGPIDKAKPFIAQLEKERKFDYLKTTDGLRQILWGLFKKMVIADNCATAAGIIFGAYETVPASSLMIGAFIYTMQIYADFSGYSDMAIGVSKLFGFDVSKNFNFPYFAQNIADFWRRWHMSLTAWLTEYVFTPLSITFRDYDNLGLIMAIVINFTICGIWHGANWTYILFGFLHGCYFIPLILNGTMNKKKVIAKGRMFPTAQETLNVLGTFTVVMLTFVIFRSATLGEAFSIYGKMFSTSLFSVPVTPMGRFELMKVLAFIIPMLVAEWLQREKNHALQLEQTKVPLWGRIAIYYTVAFAILSLGAGGGQAFIYFQF